MAHRQPLGGKLPKVALRFRVCAVCANDAPSRCSKCQQVRYCGAACQKSHWPRHKETCGTPGADLLAKAHLDEVVRLSITEHAAHVPAAELGTFAALAETQPWFPHLAAAGVIIAYMRVGADWLAAGDPDPRLPGAYAGYKEQFEHVVTSSPMPPDPDHQATKSLIMTIVVNTEIGKRVQDDVWPTIWLNWITGSLEAALAAAYKGPLPSGPLGRDSPSRPGKG